MVCSRTFHITSTHFTYYLFTSSSVLCRFHVKNPEIALVHSQGPKVPPRSPPSLQAPHYSLFQSLLKSLRILLAPAGTEFPAAAQREGSSAFPLPGPVHRFHGGNRSLTDIVRSWVSPVVQKRHSSTCSLVHTEGHTPRPESTSTRLLMTLHKTAPASKVVTQTSQPGAQEKHAHASFTSQLNYFCKAPKKSITHISTPSRRGRISPLGTENR